MYSCLNQGKDDLHNVLIEPPISISDIFETITDGFFYVDNNWTILYWNRSAEEIMDLPKERVVGRNLWKVFPDAVKMDFFTLYTTSKKENRAIETEISYPSKNLFFNIKTRPYPQGLAVYFKNLTVKKALALEIENTKKQLEALLNALKMQYGRLTLVSSYLPQIMPTDKGL